MPPIRKTLGRTTNAFAAYAPHNFDRTPAAAAPRDTVDPPTPRNVQSPGDDHGFNPAWALAPEPVFTPAPKPTYTFSPRTPIFNPSPTAPSPQAPSSQGSAIAAPQCTVESVPKQDDIDAVQLVFMAPLMVMWGVKTAVCSVGATIWDGVQYAKDRIRSVTGEAGQPVKSRSRRYDPISRSSRRTPKKKGEESMLALPPHMVGATPNVVRRARGERLRGEAGPKTPSVEEAKQWKLFHATPMAKQPRSLQFETPSKGGSYDEAPATPYPSTPGTVALNPAYGHEKRREPKSLEFSKNIQKQQFNEWVAVLHQHGIRVSKLRPPLLKLFKFPTQSILAMDKADDESLEILAKCLTDSAFTATHRLVLPAVTYPDPKEFKKASNGISLESYVQQSDGCCKACRGFSWAGKVETRQIKPGAKIPVKSQHKSVVPYTAEEKSEFKKGRYEMLYRRWCQESRYDWIFEEPDLSKKDKKGKYLWTIPSDDPRLRHTAIDSLQRRMDKNGKKLYTSDAVEHRQKLIRDFTKQDIAAHLLIRAIKKENSEVAKVYEEANLERKRRQVSEKMCVRQVKIIVEKPGQLATVNFPVLQPERSNAPFVSKKPSLFDNPAPQLFPTIPTLAPTVPDYSQQPVFEFSPAKQPEYSMALTTKKRSMDEAMDEEYEEHHDNFTVQNNKKQKQRHVGFLTDGPDDMAAPDALQLTRTAKRVKFSSTHQGPTIPQNLASPTKSILKSRIPDADRADLMSPISKGNDRFQSSLSSLPSVGDRPSPLGRLSGNYATSDATNKPSVGFTFTAGLQPKGNHQPRVQPQPKPFKFELPAAFNPKIIDQYEKGIDDAQDFWDRVGKDNGTIFKPSVLSFGGASQPQNSLFGATSQPPLFPTTRTDYTKGMHRPESLFKPTLKVPISSRPSIEATSWKEATTTSASGIIDPPNDSGGSACSTPASTGTISTPRARSSSSYGFPPPSPPPDDISLMDIDASIANIYTDEFANMILNTPSYRPAAFQLNHMTTPTDIELLLSNDSVSRHRLREICDHIRFCYSRAHNAYANYMDKYGWTDERELMSDRQHEFDLASLEHFLRAVKDTVCKLSAEVPGEVWSVWWKMEGNIGVYGQDARDQARGTWDFWAKAVGWRMKYQDGWTTSEDQPFPLQPITGR